MPHSFSSLKNTLNIFASEKKEAIIKNRAVLRVIICTGEIFAWKNLGSRE